MPSTFDPRNAQKQLQDYLAYMNSPAQDPFIFEGQPLPKVYQDGGIGSIAFICELQTSIDEQVRHVFKFKEDKRGEVGHMVKQLKRVRNNHPGNEAYQKLYLRFLKNAYSVVLIFAEPKDMSLTVNGRRKTKIPSLECRDMLEFSRFGDEYEGLKLCDKAFYANEHIPNADIFGSGCFVAPDKIATAAHVLEEAVDAKTDPDKLLFVRRHFVYGSNESIGLYPSQIFKLDQANILEEGQIVNGQKGDSAWVRVKPYFDRAGANRHFGAPPEKPLEMQQSLYALGHGLGVPMKISFDSAVGKLPDEYWFHSDMDVFPGNSGSPVFDARTQELVGIVSALHHLTLSITDTGCIRLKPEMDKAHSAVSSRIEPLLKTIQ